MERNSKSENSKNKFTTTKQSPAKQSTTKSKSNSQSKSSVTKANPDEVRLNKLIADSGLASRRKADLLIEEGSVLVNGKKVYELGIKVNPRFDRVTVSGKPLQLKADPIYIMFHKPKGVLTTMSDPFERPCIQDYVHKLPMRVFPIGRLDWDSEGLLILTNDGDYSNRVMHPKEEVTKTYLVKLNAQPSPEQINKLLLGVPILGGRGKARHIELLNKGKGEHPWLKVIIAEGKNRQIRKMFEKIGFDVIKLQRVAIGRLRLGNLERGKMLFLNEAAAERVFISDAAEEVPVMKTYRRQSLRTVKKNSKISERKEKWKK